MSGPLRFTVTGTPAPKGSKSYTIKGGRAHGYDASPRLNEWRAQVTAAARETAARVGWETLTGPVQVSLVFHRARPKSHYGTGTNAKTVRHDAPWWHAGTPDIDKLTRAVLDALTVADVYVDDAQVTKLSVMKLWSMAAEAEIYVEPVRSYPSCGRKP